MKHPSIIILIMSFVLVTSGCSGGKSPGGLAGSLLNPAVNLLDVEVLNLNETFNKTTQYEFSNEELNLLDNEGLLEDEDMEELSKLTSN